MSAVLPARSAERQRGSRMAGSAYWAMVRRIVFAAGVFDAVSVPFYGLLGSPTLAVFNVFSVGIYVAAYLLILQRRNLAGMALIWLEVLVHAVVGSLLIGWDSGLHYVLLMFIPGIVVGSSRRNAVALVLLLLVFYLGLDTVCGIVGALEPLPGQRTQLVRWVNITLVFGMVYSGASFYRGTVIKAERRLLKQATTDPLTGLANRSHFYTRVGDELTRASRNPKPMGVVLADIDFFKRINDEFGHGAGDKVLVQVAAVLQANLRDIDVLARWGGEEFLALLPASDLATATAVAERARHAVETAPFDIGGTQIRVTMSFGVSEMNGKDDMQPATARADAALYASKNGGRNRVS